MLGNKVNIINTSTVSGGSINEAYCLHTGKGKYMLKLNNKNAYPYMFACEVEGLNAIADTHTIGTPQVILQDDYADQSFLVLEWIESRRSTQKSDEALGLQLAQMHMHTSETFGFHQDNYMGSMKQSNRKHKTWADFYIEERLQPMVKAAVDYNRLKYTDLKSFEMLYSKLDKLFDEESPSLIHGDLWGGNYLISTDETPYLIDPAVNYGNRELDIAMTTLFGGFSPGFYHSYHEALPLNSGWQHRIDLWNLYPLLLHLNLFGASYLSQVRNALEKYLT